MKSKIISTLEMRIKEIKDSEYILHSLIKRELVGKYKNSIIGFGWHFLMPILMLLVYHIAFSSGIRNEPIDNFSAYLASGLFAFTFIVSELSNGSGCIVNNSGLIKKMYFPREIIVLSHVICSFIIMVIGYSVVFLLLAITGNISNIVPLIAVPVIFSCVLIFVLGNTLLFSSITVYFRDIQYFLSSITIAFMFLSPVYFSPNDTSGLLSTIIWLNPITYYIEALHSCIYYGQFPELSVVIICIMLAIMSFISGLVIFYRLKRGFAERL